MKFYRVSNLWEAYKEDCPFISKLPIVGLWGFGVFARAYFKRKAEIGEELT